jgi:hypothetical protein
MTGNANPAGTHHDECAAFQLLRVFFQNPVELCDFGFQGSAWKPKEYDACESEALLENQLAKIPVCNKENPLRFPGDCKHVFIGKTRGIIAGDSGNVMSKLVQVGNQSKVSALVEQKFHRAASDRVPFGGLGETSSPVTIAFA